MRNDTPTKLWTRQELAELLKVHVSTVDRLISDEELDTVLFGRSRRIPDPAVQDFLARRLQPAAENVRKPGRKPATAAKPARKRTAAA